MRREKMLRAGLLCRDGPLFRAHVVLSPRRELLVVPVHPTVCEVALDCACAGMTMTLHLPNQSPLEVVSCILVSV